MKIQTTLPVIEGLLDLPGVLAAYHFTADGHSAESVGTACCPPAGLAAAVCAAELCMGGMQARAWTLMSGWTGFHPANAVVVMGGSHAMIASAGYGVCAEIGEVDLDRVVGAVARWSGMPRDSHAVASSGGRPVPPAVEPAVLAACRFTDDGTVVDHSESLDARQASFAARLCAGTTGMARMQCDSFSEFTRASWSPLVGWAIVGPGAAICARGDRALFVDTTASPAPLLGSLWASPPAPRSSAEALSAVHTAGEPTFLSHDWMRQYAHAWNADTAVCEGLRELSATVHLAVLGTSAPAMQLLVRGGRAMSTGLGSGAADFVLAAHRDDWRRLATGQVRPRAALRTGRLQFSGSLLAATRHVHGFEQAVHVMTRVVARW